jgi:hypothetical protein
MARTRGVWRWLGVLWVFTGATVSVIMLYLGVATFVDLGWRGRSLGAFVVGGVAIAMTVLGAWTLHAEFSSPASPPGRVTRN